MYAEMMSAGGGSLRTVFGPIQKMNQMTIAHVEKIAALQMESMTTYTNLGIGRLKTAAEVNDPWSFMTYLVTQSAYLAKVGEHMIADMQKLSRLSGEFVEKARSVAHEEARAIGGASLGDVGKGAQKKAA